MKLQPSSKQELRRIALGVAVCDVIMVAGLFLLSQFGIGTFPLIKILLGALGGSAVTLLSFAIMCLTVQQAVNFEDQKKMKAFFQASYNGRLMLQAIWVIICFAVPQIHVIAGAAPLLFPSVIILHLQMKGKLVPPDPPRTSSEVILEDDEEEEKNLGPFEI